MNLEALAKPSDNPARRNILIPSTGQYPLSTTNGYCVGLMVCWITIGLRPTVHDRGTDTGL